MGQDSELVDAYKYPGAQLNSRAGEAGRLNKLIKKAESVLRCSQDIKKKKLNK